MPAGMIRTLVFIVVVAGTSFHYTDLQHGNVVTGVLLPIVNLVSLISLALWFVMRFHHLGISQTTTRDDGGFFGDGDGGG